MHPGSAQGSGPVSAACVSGIVWVLTVDSATMLTQIYVGNFPTSTYMWANVPHFFPLTLEPAKNRTNGPTTLLHAPARRAAPAGAALAAPADPAADPGRGHVSGSGGSAAEPLRRGRGP